MSDTATYDESKVYNVRLTRPVTYGRARFLPLHLHEVTGRVLNAIVAEHGADAIDSASEQD